MKYLIIYLKKYMRESILAPLFKMLEALFDLFVPIVVARLINTGIGERDSGVVWQSFMILIALALIGLLCSFVAQYFAAKAATGTAAGMRHDLMKHIYGLDSSSIDQIGTSTLITRMTSDMNLALHRIRCDGDGLYHRQRHCADLCVHDSHPLRHHLRGDEVDLSPLPADPGKAGPGDPGDPAEPFRRPCYPGLRPGRG